MWTEYQGANSNRKSGSQHIEKYLYAPNQVQAIRACQARNTILPPYIAMSSSLPNTQDCNAHSAEILQRGRLSSDRGSSSFRVTARARSGASMEVSMEVLKQV